MKKVFIDCGSHNGSSVRHFCRTRNDWQEYEFWCFEPDPQHWDNWNPGPANAVLMKSAVGISDESLPFYVVKGTSTQEGGSTLSTAKDKHNKVKMQPRGYHFETIIVNSVDLTQLIENMFEPDDYIILKVDIEGAEYALFDHMLEKGTFSYINELYGEWHNWRCGRCPRPTNVKHYKSPEDLEYEKKFKDQYGLTFTEWDAIDE